MSFRRMHFINYFIGCCSGGCTLVSIGTTVPDAVVGAAVTSKLSVGVVSSYQLYTNSATSSATGVRNITASTSAPSGGSDGDIWIKYTA